MSQLIQGRVTIDIPDDLMLPADAGTLTDKEMAELFPVRYGLSLVCSATADSMRKDPSRLTVPGVSPDRLEDMGRQASDLKQIIKDVEVVLTRLMQASRLLDHSAYTELRRVLASVRGLEKFDPKLTDLVPDLIAFFTTRATSTKSSSQTTTVPASQPVAG